MKKIERSIQSSIDQLSHPSFREIAETPVRRMESMDWITRQEPVKRKRSSLHVWAGAAVCAAVLLLGGLGWFVQFRMVDSMIDLDVNPSFEIAVSRCESVLEVRGLNAEAKELLKGRSYRGWKLEEAMDSLFGDLPRTGYLSAQKTALLLSVRSRSAQRGDELKRRLTEQISALLLKKNIRPDIFVQNLPMDSEERKESEKAGVSAGKLQLIHALLKKEPGLSREALLSMSIEELSDWMEEVEEIQHEDDLQNPDSFGESDDALEDGEEEQDEEDGEPEDDDGEQEDDREERRESSSPAKQTQSALPANNAAVPSNAPRKEEQSEPDEEEDEDPEESHEDPPEESQEEENEEEDEDVSER